VPTSITLHGCSRTNDYLTRSFCSSSDFIYPLFIHEDSNTVEIPSMPGCLRHSLASMMQEVQDAQRCVPTVLWLPSNLLLCG
jgi:delta-aminolevulinic acid dehydratase/porphobilinogen synthase